MRLCTLPVIGVTALMGAFPALALGPQDVYGVWRQPDSGSLVQIYPCSGAVCAKLVWISGPNRVDVKNPDPALRNRSMVGIEIWHHAKETAPLQWSGSAYNPLDGATVYGTLHLTGEGALVVASCNLNLMPCSERTWTKVSEDTVKAIPTLVSRPQVDGPKAGQAPASQPQAGQPQGGQLQSSQPKQAAAVEKKIAAKPKPSPVSKAKKPKEHARVKASHPGDSQGYYDLPHIHPAR
jgi:uncharacterized protein (DUF2147 family)